MTTNHKAEAAEHVRMAATIPSNNDETNPAAGYMLQIAQVHATLALVEATDALVAEAKALFVAQRTGNLIAYAVMNNLGGLPEATEMKSAIRQGLAIA